MNKNLQSYSFPEHLQLKAKFYFCRRKLRNGSDESLIEKNED